MDPVIDYLTAQAGQPNVFVALGTVAACILLSSFRRTWHVYRSWITFVHETGHALAATLTGGKPVSVVTNSDTSGLTQHLSTGWLPSRIITSMAGYIAPAVMGLVLSIPSSMGYTNITVVLLIFMLVGSILLYRITMAGPLFPQLYGLLVSAVVGLVLAGLVVVGEPAKSWLVTAVIWSLLVGGFKPILESRNIRLMSPEPSGSDQETLRSLTHISESFWEGMFLLISVACLLGATYLQFGSEGLVMAAILLLARLAIQVGIRWLSALFSRSASRSEVLR